MIKKSPYIGPYFFYLQKRARIKYNFQSFIGEQGSGKSYWAIIEALVQDPTFTEERIVYGSIGFLDALDMLEDRTLKGRTILWDDAGVGLPSSEWYSLSNRVIKLVQQTVRTLHPTIKFTMPELSYLDATQRRVLTSILDCDRKTEDRTDVRIYTKKRIRIMDKSYHRKFCYSMGSVKMKYGVIRVKHIPENLMPDIMKRYEIQQRKFKFQTRKKLRELLEGMREKNMTTDVTDDYSTVTLTDLEKTVTYEHYKRVFANVKPFLHKNRRIDIDKVMREFKLSRNIAKAIKRFWDKKLLPDQVKEELEILTDKTLNKN